MSSENCRDRLSAQSVRFAAKPGIQLPDRGCVTTIEI
jgi:hypothetical protein